MRMLLVEDTPEVLEGTCELLKMEFPSARIETATTGKEAREKVDQAERTGRIFHVAILDLKLPSDVGRPDEFDFELCEHTRHMLPEAVVVHYSGYKGLPEVVEHVRTIGYDMIIDKLKDGPRGLINAIRQGYGDKLVARTKVLVERQTAGPASAFTAQRFMSRCRTSEIDALQREIRENFDVLDPRSQKEIQRYLSIERSRSGLHVMFGRRANEGGPRE